MFFFDSFIVAMSARRRNSVERALVRLWVALAFVKSSTFGSAYLGTNPHPPREGAVQGNGCVVRRAARSDGAWGGRLVLVGLLDELGEVALLLQLHDVVGHQILGVPEGVRGVM